MKGNLRLGLKVLVLVTALALPCATLGKVRKTVDYSSFINSAPSSTMLAFFDAPDALWTITGGVVLHGQAKFFMEQRGNVELVPTSQIALSVNATGNVFLDYDHHLYALEIFPGLACPLGRFIQRNGLIAYTELDGVTEAMEKRIYSADLVDSNEPSGFDNSVAKEFVGTPFERLFAAMDYVDVTPLPENIKNAALGELNRKIGAHADSQFTKGSYIHADFQTTYQVYLVRGPDRVDAAGVPLRYELKYNPGGLPFIADVEVFSQNWPDDEHLGDLNNDNVRVSQYDVVSAFQAAGILRELHLANNGAFETFVSQACQVRPRTP
jgi:hypothetical protein